MEINELLSDMFELKCVLDEAKNLCFAGKVVQCDRKLQGAQVRCENIITNLMNKQDKDVVVTQNTETTKS